jgi:hypothetical protein
MPVLKVSWIVVLLAAAVVAQLPGKAGNESESFVPTTVTEPVPTPTTPQTRRVVFKKGTEVKLRLAESLSSKTSVIGQVVELVLDEDLKAEDVVLASKGARVIGKVTQGKKDEKRRHGKEVAIQLQYVVTPYGHLGLTGEQRGVVRRNVGAIVASTSALGLTGLLLSWSATTRNIMPENTPVVATAADDFEVTVPANATSAAGPPTSE